MIIVDDVNDNKPDFVLFPPISIDEDQAPVMFLGTFEATDADSGTNAQVTYSISGDPNNTFSISYLDGRLYQNKTVDFEVNREISIIIVATDQGKIEIYQIKHQLKPANDTGSILFIAWIPYF